MSLNPPIEMPPNSRSATRRAGLSIARRRAEHLVRYTEVTDCPACGGGGTTVEQLCRGMYRFGPFDIPYPHCGSIPILRCDGCGLIYKGMVPDSVDLRHLFAKAASQVWSSHGYKYDAERLLVMRFMNGIPCIDVLEVGSGDGGLVGAFDGMPGRRAALDVVWNDRCSHHLSGEYIIQYIEDPLCWSGVPYDAVLVFDVMEHLYHADIALSNLASLTRQGGVMIVQTGDANYIGNPAHLREWWYLNLLEHHMVWTSDSLAQAARRHGFRLEYSETGNHKDAKYMPTWKRAGASVLRALAHVPGGVRTATTFTSYDPRLVSDPKASDHFTAVLRRVD